MSSINPSLSPSVKAYFTWENALEKFPELGFDYLPEDHPPLGEWERCPSAFKDADNKSAAVMVTLDGEAAILYDHVEGCSHTIRRNSYKSLSAIEKRRLAEERRQRDILAKAEKRRRAEEAITNARDLFSNASPCLRHDYLDRKNITLPGCKTDGRLLLIPLTDINGEIQSIQRIAPDGSKRLFAGAPLKGSAYRIGTVENFGTAYVTEGAATGGSVYRSTNKPVVCAMAAANLLNVAKDLRRHNPQLKIIIAGDDDQDSINNIGKKKAMAAADAVNGFVFLPSYCDDCDGKCSDHNDVANCTRTKK